MLGSVLDFPVLMLACALNERMQKKLNYAQQEVRVLEEVVAALNGATRRFLSTMTNVDASLSLAKA